MNTRLTVAIAIVLSATFAISSVQAQISLSKFDFNGTPLTAASQGPNATAVNGAAGTDGRGVRFATGGANVGLDLAVPAASLLPSLTSMDLVVEYARNEGQAYIFEGGQTSLRLEIGTLLFSYAVRRNPNNNNNPELITLQYTDLAVAQSGAFVVIRAAYDASTGFGALFVNNMLVDSYQGTPGRNLVWTDVTSFTIGRMMDGGGNNFVTLGSISLNGTIIGALPVELVSFSALRRSDAVELKWNTATELNNYGFEVERSFDGKKWEILDLVPGHGTVNSPRSYSFRDADVLRSNRVEVSYRLRQIDRDGSFEYSSTVNVKLDGSIGFAVQPAFPNPFNPSTTFSVRLQNEESVTVRIIDAAGRLVETLVAGETMAAGVHNLSFHADNLPSGIYFATVHTATQSASIKLMLQK